MSIYWNWGQCTRLGHRAQGRALCMSCAFWPSPDRVSGRGLHKDSLHSSRGNASGLGDTDILKEAPSNRGREGRRAYAPRENTPFSRVCETERAGRWWPRGSAGRRVGVAASGTGPSFAPLPSPPAPLYFGGPDLTRPADHTAPRPPSAWRGCRARLGRSGVQTRPRRARNTRRGAPRETGRPSRAGARAGGRTGGRAARAGGPGPGPGRRAGRRGALKGAREAGRAEPGGDGARRPRRRAAGGPGGERARPEPGPGGRRGARGAAGGRVPAGPAGARGGARGEGGAAPRGQGPRHLQGALAGRCPRPGAREGDPVRPAARLCRPARAGHRSPPRPPRAPDALAATFGPAAAAAELAARGRVWRRAARFVRGRTAVAVASGPGSPCSRPRGTRTPRASPESRQPRHPRLALGSAGDRTRAALPQGAAPARASRPRLGRFAS